MTIPHNSKLWIYHLLGHWHIAQDITELMSLCGFGGGIERTTNSHRPGIYIDVYKDSYEFAGDICRDSTERSSVFIRNSKIEIALEALFPAPELDRKYAIVIRDKAHSQVTQEVLFKLGYSWASSGFAYFDTKDKVLIIDPAYKRITCTMGTHGLTTIYYSQLLNIKHDGEQAKVQGTDQPEQRSTGSSAVRFQSRKCKVATGQRYTGNQTGYRRSRTKVQRGEIKRTICIAKDTGRTYGTPGSQGGSGSTAQVERGVVLDNPYSGIKTKYDRLIHG